MFRSGQGIEGSVAVVTGASSGIGRAMAHALAQRGGNVVLAARSEGDLQEAARECERAGGQTLAVPTDVGDEAAVQELPRRAVERFGRVDVWVNNAGVMAYGHFEETRARSMTTSSAPTSSVRSTALAPRWRASVRSARGC